MGVINFENEEEEQKFSNLKDATVELYEKGKRDTPLATEQLTISRIFQFNVPINKEYMIRVIPKKPKTGSIHLPIEQAVSFKEGETFTNTQFLTITLKESEAKAAEEFNAG